MSFRKSIRWRIQSWHALLLLAMCSGFGITAYQLEKSNGLDLIDQDLEIRLNRLVSGLNQGGGRPGRRPPPPPHPWEEEFDEDGRPSHFRPPGGPRDEFGEFEEDEPPDSPGFRSAEIVALFDGSKPAPFYFQVWRRDDTLLAKTDHTPGEVTRPAGTRDGGADKGIRTRGEYREAFVFTPPGECLLAGTSMAGLDREMRDFGWKLVAIGGGVMAFGLAVGWWIASRALRPISDISAAASRIAAGNLDERIRSSETESELGRLASLLDDTFQRLDTAFDEQARFTSDAAHELRTPVSIILAQTQLALSKDRDAAEYRETIEMTRRAAQRMHSLIESLLQLAVLDASGKPLETDPCDLADIAREQVSLLGPLAAEKRISVVSTFGPAPCVAHGGHMAQIVINLLTNAVKFCPPGAEVRVLTGTKGEHAMLSVADNGPGIPAEHLPGLFGRFYRVESSRNRATGGAGLGLAICKRIAEAHGGELAVESREGEGSTFTLTIPTNRED